MKRGVAVGLPAAMVKPCPPRAARKSEWLQSALAHHHSPQPGVENEIVVLATGIDQYLQEVFHHLAYPNQEDAVSAEDFTVLCAVLGLHTRDHGEPEGRNTTTDDDHDAQREDRHEFQDVVYAGLPRQLCFKDFHSRLCGFFRVRAARNGSTGEEAPGSGAVRLPVSEETELVEREIRLRWPRFRRRKCVSFNLAKDQQAASVRTVTKRSHKDDKDSVPGEAAALRELVEDLRSALQGSDARCLALEVALRQERARNALNTTYTCSTSSDVPHSKSPCTAGDVTRANGTNVSSLASQGRRRGVGGEATAAARTASPQRCDASRDPLLRELKLIRSSRDGQLEEAIKYNHRLEEELGWAYQEARRHEAVERALRKENTEIRRRAEEAREALRQGLQRVRQIQEQASAVPALEARVKQLETELHQKRSLCTCKTDSTPQPSFPVGAEDAYRTDGDCLQRAVEGKAASDEEEEEERAARPGHRGREEADCCLAEVKKLISRLHGCGKGCQRPSVMMMPQGCLHDNSLHPAITEEACRASSWTGPNQTAVSRSCGQKKWPEEKRKLGETERVHLSLLEERLTDALLLLLELRNKNVSRRALGKILMDTLDMCSSHGNGPSWLLKVADTLCVQLSSHELLRDGGEDGTMQVTAPSSSHQPPTANPLLISC